MDDKEKLYYETSTKGMTLAQKVEWCYNEGYLDDEDLKRIKVTDND